MTTSDSRSSGPAEPNPIFRPLSRWSDPIRSLGENLDPFEVDEDEAADTEPVMDEDATVRPAPPRSDEFICSVCHMVYHRSHLANASEGVCADCD